MDIKELKPAVMSLVGACAASLYCLLPLAVIVLGLGVATGVLLTEVGLVAFPEEASQLFRWAMVAAANQMERFDAEGAIVSLDLAKRLLTIAHGDIKGFRSPMTMAFPVASPELLQRIAPGDRVKCSLERTPTHLAVIALTKLAAAGMAQALPAVAGMT